MKARAGFAFCCIAFTVLALVFWVGAFEIGRAVTQWL